MQMNKAITFYNNNYHCTIGCTSGYPNDDSPNIIISYNTTTTSDKRILQDNDRTCQNSHENNLILHTIKGVFNSKICHFLMERYTSHQRVEIIIIFYRNCQWSQR
ncbi:uncharacterized protein LOC131998192 [Stomoxys calcitrans]|uniref:uncharacterized protein LOC131998192 n=1 Tax=Stomoxys calcitrans TaxID=35570 RepID=UPI0027E2F34A|nr:uncharacterized protein LOC131998192 [Stomoxys calcitrans]